MSNAPEPTPYDTGERCEAKGWLPYGTKVDESTPAENFGKVDFDDENGDTLCVAYVERNADGTYTLHVDPLCEPAELNVVVHQDPSLKPVTP